MYSILGSGFFCSRTLVSKLNTKLALIWKEDFGPLGNSPVLLLLSPGKTPLTTTVAKFLETYMCGGSWYLDPSLSPFLVKFTQILESIWLDNPHKAAVLSVGCASFSSTLFPSTQLSANMLRYSTLWTASFFGNECLWLTLLVKGVNVCLQWLVGLTVNLHNAQYTGSYLVIIEITIIPLVANVSIQNVLSVHLTTAVYCSNPPPHQAFISKWGILALSSQFTGTVFYATQ